MPGVLPSGVRFRCTLLAGVLASIAFAHAASAQPAPNEPPVNQQQQQPAADAPPPPQAVPSDPAPPPAPEVRTEADLRAEFGLPRATPAQTDCSSGLGFACAVATDAFAPRTPYGLSTWLDAAALRRLPVGDAMHDAVAGFALGASRDDAGILFGGATGTDNRWTIDGAPADNIRTGLVDTRVPLTFLEGIFVVAGGFSARDRASLGGTIDAQLVRGTPEHELRTDVWSSWTRYASRRPIAPGAYTVRRMTSDVGPDATVSLVATGPLGGTAWYAAGIAPSVMTSELRWEAGRLRDDDGDGIPDGLPGVVATSPISTIESTPSSWIVPVMARAGMTLGRHEVDATVIGHAAGDARYMALATQQSGGVDRTTITGDVIASWRARWADTELRAQLSWHRSARSESPRVRAAGGMPQLLSAYVPTSLADDPTLASACNDSSSADPAPTIPNCPVPFGLFASGGAGQLTDITGDRPSASVDATHRLGRHVVRAGATVEDARLVTESRFTSAVQLRSLFGDQITRRRFFDGECGERPTDPCDYAVRSELTYRTVYAAAYAEDTFAVREDLQINGGLRWELMWVGPRLHFSNQLAPRAGVVWDPLGGGRSRLWLSVGRTFAMLPTGLGPTVIQRDDIVDDFELMGDALGRTVTHGDVFSVADDTKPVEQNELSFGAEVALVGALRATAWGQGRYLRNGLETTPAGFTNPGNPGGGNGDLEAVRESEQIAVALEMAKPERIGIRAGVLWGRVVGTWTGMFDTFEGLNVLDTSAWNFNASNLHGPLPSDPGTRLFVEAAHHATVGPVALSVAARLTAASGRTRSVLANGVDGTIYLLPRGAAGRGPLTSQANARLAAEWSGYTVTLDLFNLFDRRTATDVDDVYSDDSVRPIEGGSYEDLVFLKTDSGRPAARRTAYQLPLAYQAPLSIALGVHKAF